MFRSIQRHAEQGGAKHTEIASDELTGASFCVVGWLYKDVRRRQALGKRARYSSSITRSQGTCNQEATTRS